MLKLDQVCSNAEAVDLSVDLSLMIARLFKLLKEIFVEAKLDRSSQPQTKDSAGLHLLNKNFDLNEPYSALQRFQLLNHDSGDSSNKLFGFSVYILGNLFD